VQSRFDEINTTLPEGVTAIPYYDQGNLVNKASATVTTALWQGALLVAIVVFVFLGGWRPSLVVVLSIPFSVGFAFIAMNILGIGARTIVARSSTEVIAPLIAAVIVVIVVFLPLFSLQGVEGKTFRPLAASAALAMWRNMSVKLQASLCGGASRQSCSQVFYCWRAVWQVQDWALNLRPP